VAAGGGINSVWGATDAASTDEGAVLCEMKCLAENTEETEPKLHRKDGDRLRCDKLYGNRDWRKGCVLQARCWQGHYWHCVM
jgi:hypothetical protein